MPTTLSRSRLRTLLAQQDDLFTQTHPKSKELFERAQASLLGGVPMNWMVRWASPFPVFVDSASGAYFTDVDGNKYLDLCLGDTGAMTGHAPGVTVEAIATQAAKGLTYMLPTENAIWVGEEQITAMQEAVAAMDAALNDAETFIEADLDFHLALAEASQNALIPTLIDSIVDLLREQRTRIFRVEGGPQRGQFHHKRILEAIIRRDPEAAHEAMHAHLRQVREDSEASAKA